MTDIRRTVSLDAPLERVWAYLTESDKIAEWLMPNTFAPALGHRFTMDCPPGIGSGAPIACVVTRIEAPKDDRAHLAYSWTIDAPPLETRLSISLRRVDGATRLDLVHSGWEVLEPRESHVRDRHEEGWDALLQGRLRPLVEKT